MQQDWRIWLSVYIKGLAMGAADIVPGVSGGTIAFITGIYERLIDALKAIGPGTLLVWRREGLAPAWRSIDGTFLVVLALGVGTSIVSLARLIGFFLRHYPIELWSFFFGLILVSAIHIARQIRVWQARDLVALAAGCLVGFCLTQLSPAEVEPTGWLLVAAGSVAICAMILPGVSGSFILLMFGLYGPILDAIKGFHLDVLALFAAGCVIGLLAFSRVLSWLLHHYHALTLAGLTGLMVGSLNKVWPWKQTLQTRVNSKGELVPLLEKNLWPGDFATQLGQDPRLFSSLLLMVAGIVLVLAFEFYAGRQSGSAGSE